MAADEEHSENFGEKRSVDGDPKSLLGRTPRPTTPKQAETARR
jgi:hypothetical protein